MQRCVDGLLPRALICLMNLVCLGNLSVPAQAAPTRPNVLIILADDLGYSDLGCYGGEIETPHLDGLAANGVRWTQFYNTARCWPTRAALMTGYYAQQVRRDAVPGIKSGGQGIRPAWAKLMPERLRSAGYHSYHSGKWHIDGAPLANEFEHSYELNDHGRYFFPQRTVSDGQKLPPVRRDAGYYATTEVASRAIEHLQEHSREHPDEPFLEFLAFTAPHFPLQALPEDISRYRDRYHVGWDVIRRQRAARVRELGLVAADAADPEFDVGPPYHFPDDLETLGPDEVNRPIPWEQLTASQQLFQAAKMAVHAAMVDRMDREIGRVLDQLREMKAFDNTLILFLSDNGASAEIMVRDDGHDRNAVPGSAATHLCLGPGWSTVCNTPFRRHKTWVHEGGIATPLIVHWPAGIATKGGLRHQPGHVIDIAPTLLELAGIEPAQSLAATQAPEFPGRSLVAAFTRDEPIARDGLWWSHEGNRALRQGDWKLVAAGKDAPWELYDLRADRTERHNRAAEEPARVTSMAAEWARRNDAYARLAKEQP